MSKVLCYGINRERNGGPFILHNAKYSPKKFRCNQNICPTIELKFIPRPFINHMYSLKYVLYLFKIWERMKDLSLYNQPKWNPDVGKPISSVPVTKSYGCTYGLSKMVSWEINCFKSFVVRFIRLLYQLANVVIQGHIF